MIRSLIATGVLALVIFGCVKEYDGVLQVHEGFVIRNGNTGLRAQPGAYTGELKIDKRAIKFETRGDGFSIPLPERLKKLGKFPSKGTIPAREIGQEFNLRFNEAYAYGSSYQQPTTVSCYLDSPREECEYRRDENGEQQRACETITTGTASAIEEVTPYTVTRIVYFIKGNREIARFTSTSSGRNSYIVDQSYCR